MGSSITEVSGAETIVTSIPYSSSFISVLPPEIFKSVYIGIKLNMKRICQVNNNDQIMAS